MELHSEDYKTLVRDSMTPLRNAFIDDFVFQAQMYSGRSDSVHLHRVKSRFRTLADRIVGPDVVKEVLDQPRPGLGILASRRLSDTFPGATGE